MGMAESGRAVRELLAALYGVTERDLAVLELERKARRGGSAAVRSVRDLVKAGRAATYRVACLERELGFAQASIRAMVGQVLPEDPRVPIDPPADHVWTTATDAQGRFDDPHMGRLYCVTCTMDAPNGSGVVLAAECLERAR